MGSYINLGINKLDVDWGKNCNFANHSKLFQKKDFEIEVPYYYADNIIEYKKGAKKTLREIKGRLDLLGYDLKSLKKIYNKYCETYELYNSISINITFKEYFLLIKNIDITKVDNINILEDSSDKYDLKNYFSKEILENKEILLKLEQIVEKIKKMDLYEFCGIGSFINNMDPYITLRILAENPKNLDFSVEWRYEDVIENGWVKREDVIQKLDESNKILIVTEGSTDSFVIKKTINELYPSISDFFDFIDMEKNYPFTGVGNLANFCLGLFKIHIQNNIIALFDNDTAGNESYNKVKDIKGRPRNLLICKLPTSKLFNKFDTIGPSGKKKVNINGKAVAIECFLDFSSVNIAPTVRWQSYKEKMNQYQGVLENKELYINKFKATNLKDGSYNCEKLKFLIDYIISSWINR